jgi:hypothetical protein
VAGFGGLVLVAAVIAVALARGGGPHRSETRPPSYGYVNTLLPGRPICAAVLAGPQYRRSGTIRLRVTPGGFATVAEPSLRVDDVNFGMSPGDARINEPYAYVGPPAPRTGPFWNQPFGAARSMRELGDADPAQVLAFFAEGRSA